MPPNGYHVQAQQYSYDAYDGSDYDSPSSSRHGSDSHVGGWRAPQAVNSGPPAVHAERSSDYASFDFGTTHNPSSQRLSVNTRLRDEPRDEMAQHLLYENALLDSAKFEILHIDEVDALKKEHTRLIARVDATRRKLALESKVKDAAHNLQRLYALQKVRPDTPQRDDSRSSGISMYDDRDKKGTRKSDGAESLLQAQGEFADSLKKVDELNLTLRELLERQAEVERKLLSHTAAILAEEANNKATSAIVGMTNGHHSMYVADEFDGLRDILRGAPSDSLAKSQAYEQQMSMVQERLEQLNLELRSVIDQASSRNDDNSLDNSDDPAARVESRFTRVEYSLDILKQQHQDTAVQMETLNKQIHDTLVNSADGQSLLEPPRAEANGATQQVQYLQDLLQQHGSALGGGGGGGSNQKLAEYEDTVAGLWDILQSEAPSSNDESSRAAQFHEPFSLPAFSTRCQHLFDRAQSAKEQQDILRRQIQQQRDLNGKSDVEKDQKFDELQDSHREVTAERDAAQEELAKFMVQHQQAEAEVTHLRSEQSNIINEIEELRRTVDTRQQERDEISRALDTHKTNTQSLHDHIAELEAQLSDGQVAKVQQDMENLESEVIRLTTELTMAKADLDVAHGSRAERAGAQATEVKSLGEKNKEMSDQLTGLRAELQEMTNEFQAMTKESIDLEKEREQLDSLIDTLRERVEDLEGQLSDEKVRWLGMKAPNTTIGPDGQPRESMSMTVLRQEFKKMVRETRAEGVRLIRAEQEERRRLEAEVRKIRQANGPLGRTAAQNLTPTPAAPAAASTGS